jgi:hypothetical protein
MEKSPYSLTPYTVYIEDEPTIKWAVNTENGVKYFEDGETAHDFYLLNKHRYDRQRQKNDEE